MGLLGILLTMLGIGVAALLVWLIVRQTTRKRRLSGLVLLAVWLAISFPIMWEFDSPYMRYEQAVIACGHQPVIATNFAAGYSYDLPGDPGYGPGIFTDTYYCSAKDAEAVQKAAEIRAGRCCG